MAKLKDLKKFEDFKKWLNLLAKLRELKKWLNLVVKF